MRALPLYSLAFLSALTAAGTLPSSRPRAPALLGATAHADDAPAVVLSSCTLRGAPVVAKGTALHDAAREGRLLGHFTGALAPLTATLPIDVVDGRARVQTSAGKPSLRLDGWTPASALSVHTAKDVSVLGGNVWIASGQRVKLVRAAGSSLTAEVTVQGTQAQTVKGTGPCDAFSLDRTRPTPQEIPGNARGYLTKASSVSLFDGAAGSEILTLSMSEGSSQLFWSTESRAGFVHIKSRGDIVIDAWARLRDLSALKPGEMMDQYIPPPTQSGGAQLVLDKSPRLLTVSRELPVRLRPDDKDRPIGVVESGAEVYEVGTTAKWTNVMPKDLHVSPPDSGGFWIPSADLAK